MVSDGYAVISRLCQLVDDSIVVRQLYCPICHNKLFGDIYDESAIYECLCGFYLSGDEADYLYKAFREDLI